MTERVLYSVNKNMGIMKAALDKTEQEDIQYILDNKEKFNDILASENYIVSLSSKNKFTRILAKIFNLSFFIHQNKVLSKQWLIENEDCDCKRLVFTRINQKNYLINCIKNNLGMDFAFVPSKNQESTTKYHLVEALQNELHTLSAE